MQIVVKNKDTLLYDEFEFKCCVGINGISFSKKEGDKKTPGGSYSLGPIYKFYNTIINTNKKIKHEKLFKKNKNYDLLIPILYNTNKPKKNKGSAIFLHLTKNYKGTLGCIGLKKNDMLILLKLINKKTKIKII